MCSSDLAVDVNALPGYSGATPAVWGGDKFIGGFGITKDFEIVDYWLLRKRSRQLFTENLYARGLIRRLITNEINKGLNLEATPDADILGLDREQLAAWAENTERRYAIWGKNPELCDHRGARTLGALQRMARTMALISGDVLVVLRQGPTGIPTIDLVDAEHVSNPNTDAAIRGIRRSEERRVGKECRL